MKRSPDFYKNRKRLRTLTNDGEEYRVTIDKAWEWFNILNEQIFGNLLEPVDKITISNHKGCDVYALYHYWDKKEESSWMSFERKFENEKLFVEILGHEMIHHFQHLYDEPLGHGPSFTAWRDNFNLKGLRLYKAS